MTAENNIKDPTAYGKIKKARTSLILEHPFFASLALRLKVQEDYSCHTAWTDGAVFAYNPHYINMLSSQKLEGLTAHVVMHPACGHHTRRGTRDSSSWNKACDYVINGILMDAGFILPDGYLFKEEYNDKSAEVVYSILTEGNSENDNEEDSTEEEQEAEGAEENESEEQQSEKGRPEETEERGDEGNSEQTEEPGLAGEVRDNPGDTGGGGDGLTVDWDDALIQAAINARGIGKLPSSIERILEKRLYPKLNWQELLRQFVEQNARSDYSWLQPNKRFIHQNIYLPSLRNCELNNIFIAIDTSGSISGNDLEKFGAEVSEVLGQYPSTIHLVYCDYRISEHRQYSRSELPISIKPLGGGGTDYRPVFNLIEAGNYSPACLIYLTDLECRSYPKTHPSYPTLWVSLGKNSNIPPFGEIIRIQ